MRKKFSSHFHKEFLKEKNSVTTFIRNSLRKEFSHHFYNIPLGKNSVTTLVKKCLRKKIHNHFDEFSVRKNQRELTAPRFCSEGSNHSCNNLEFILKFHLIRIFISLLSSLLCPVCVARCLQTSLRSTIARCKSSLRFFRKLTYFTYFKVGDVVLNFFLEEFLIKAVTEIFSLRNSL